MILIINTAITSIVLLFFSFCFCVFTYAGLVVLFVIVATPVVLLSLLVCP